MAEVAEQEYNRFMRIMERSAVILYRLAKEELKNMEKTAAEIKERVINAQDPAKAMQQEMDKSLRGFRDTLEEMRVQGCIDFDTSRELNARMTEISKYYDLDDGCTKAATIDRFANECREMQKQFDKTHDKSLFKDIKERADDYSKVPRAVYMDESRLHPDIKALRADIKIKQDLKALELKKTRIKNGFDELTR